MRLSRLTSAIVFIASGTGVSVWGQTQSGVFTVQQVRDRVLHQSRSGDIIRLDPSDPAAASSGIPRIPWVKKPNGNGVQLLLSDMPETLTSSQGICMQGRVKPGLVRLVIYHVSKASDGPKVITPIVRNLGATTAHINFTRYGSSAVRQSYEVLAKNVMRDFMLGTVVPDALTLGKGDTKALDPYLDRTATEDPILVFAMYEFNIDQPAELTVLQKEAPPSRSSATALASIMDGPGATSKDRFALGKWGAGRGLFEGVDWDVSPADPSFVLDTVMGPRSLLLADGKVDGWLHGGVDRTNGGEVQAGNEGNYGTFYHVRIPYSTSDGQGWAVLALNTRAIDTPSICQNMTLVVKVDGRVVAVPSEEAGAATPLLGPPPQAGILQLLPVLQKGKLGVVDLWYTPPCASCLPAAIAFVPYHPGTAVGASAATVVK